MAKGLEAFIRVGRVATRRAARTSILVLGAAAMFTVSIGDAEARRGGRVARDIGIGIGAAIILNEVLKSGEQGGRVKAAPAPTRASPDAERIRALQTALSAHGYNAGSPDGAWGNRARGAAAEMQRDLGQPETGTLTGEQIILLRDATDGRVPRRITTVLTHAARVAEEGGMRSDSSEDDISHMQVMLTQMGFYRGPIDGTWGRSVEQAVARFQQHEGAPAIGRLTLDQSERVLGRELARAEPPVSPPSREPYPRGASEPQSPARVMSVRPIESQGERAPAAARDDSAGLRLQDLPNEIRTRVTEVRAGCKAAYDETPLDQRKGVNYLPESEAQGIQQISLDGAPAIMVDNLELCGDQIPAANCSNRGCDLAIWQFDSSGAWRQVFKEHLHSRDVDIDPATRQLRSISISLYAGDKRCTPAPGRDYTSSETCKLNVTYRDGQWQFLRDQTQ